MDETLLLAVEIAMLFERLGIGYFIGGSLASSQHGIPRATLDADIIARLGLHHIRPMLEALGDDWYADEAAIREAVSSASFFNLIHIGTAQKVDVFVAKNRAFEHRQFESAVRLSLGSGDHVLAPFFATAAHSVVAKLEWFRLGGETSDRQWNDILGIIQVQGSALDLETMQEDAESVGVADLLEKAFADTAV